MHIEKLGTIKKLDLSVNKMTVFTGQNNSGKTYTSYLLYGILSTLSEGDFFKVIRDQEFKSLLKGEITELKIDRDDILDNYITQAVSYIQKNIREIFN